MSSSGEDNQTVGKRAKGGQFQQDPEVLKEQEAQQAKAQAELDKAKELDKVAERGIVRQRVGTVTDRSGADRTDYAAAHSPSAADVDSGGVNASGKGTGTGQENVQNPTKIDQTSKNPRSVEEQALQATGEVKSSLLGPGAVNQDASRGDVTQHANPHIEVKPEININVPEQKGLSPAELAKMFSEALNAALLPLKPGYTTDQSIDPHHCCSYPGAHYNPTLPNPNLHSGSGATGFAQDHYNYGAGGSASGYAASRNSEWDSLAHIYKEIRRRPEAQLPNHQADSNHLLNLSTNHAKDLKPLETVPGFQKITEGDRLVFRFTPVKEGPVFLARLDANNKPVRDTKGELLYDILYFNADKTLNRGKSFISPDNVPEGTRSSVEQNIRQGCLEYHANQNVQKQQEKDLGWPPEERNNVRSQVTSVAASVSPHVAPTSASADRGFRPGLSEVATSVSSYLAPPPPPPPPGTNTSMSVGDPKKAAKKVATETGAKSAVSTEDQIKAARGKLTSPKGAKRPDDLEKDCNIAKD